MTTYCRHRACQGVAAAELGWIALSLRRDDLIPLIKHVMHAVKLRVRCRIVPRRANGLPQAPLPPRRRGRSRR